MFENENSVYTTNSHRCNFDVEFGIKNSTAETDQISRIVKQVKRDKQKKKDDELWEKHCDKQNIVVSITGSYVVKDNNYPSILLPKNTSHDSLFQSGAITIISNESLEEDVSYTDTSYHSYMDNSSLKPIDENDQEIQEDGDDFIMNLNDVNVQKTKIASIDDVQTFNKDNDTRHEDTNLENEGHFLTSHEIAISTKLWLLRNKINTSLEAIIELWEFEPILDGEEDLARRHKRASEFESRFCRNYLYNLGRQMDEIHKLMKSHSPRFIEKNSDQTIFQKISNAHTIIFQGLSAYQKHLASSIPGGVPEKLNDLLVHACDLWRVCTRCKILKPILYSPGRNEVYIEDIDEKCKKLLHNIRNYQENKLKLQQKPSFTISVTPKKSPKKIDKSNRLSMYTLETPYILKHQRAFWKNSLNQLSKPKNIRPKKKINNTDNKLNSKIDLAVNYMNPSMSQESFPMKNKKSEIICEPPKEDEIVTQMDILNQRESGINSNSIEHIKKPEQNLRSAMSKEQFNESLRPLLLEILQNIDNKKNLEDEKTSMMELQNVLTEIKQVTIADHINSNTDIAKKLTLQKIRSKTTTTGRKNAKLICLSPVESETEDAVNSTEPTQPPPQTVATNTSNVEIKNSKKCMDSPTQTLSLNVTNDVNVFKKPSPRPNLTLPRKDVVKIVKFQKPRAKLMKMNMPKSIITNLTKYKDSYANYTRKNNMYVIKNRKPWEIVSKISDNLLDSMVSDVVSELEIDNLLLKLYEMEFH